MKNNIKIIRVGSENSGSYPDDHSIDDCDRCLKRVGFLKLKEVPWLYKDMNDKHHKDQSWQLGYYNEGYRQYYVCEECYKSI